MRTIHVAKMKCLFRRLLVGAFGGCIVLAACLLTHTPASAAEISPEMLNAAKEGRLDDVKKLIAKGEDVNATSADGVTALMVAAVENRLPVVRALLEAGADARLQTKSGKTALFFAASRGNIEVVTRLEEAISKPGAGEPKASKPDRPESQPTPNTAAPGNAQVVYSSFGPDDSFSSDRWCIGNSAACGSKRAYWISAPFKPSATITSPSISLALVHIWGPQNSARIYLRSGDPDGEVLYAWGPVELPAGSHPEITTVKASGKARNNSREVTLQAGVTYWVQVLADGDQQTAGWYRNNQGLNGGLIYHCPTVLPCLREERLTEPLVGEGNLPAFSVFVGSPPAASGPR